MFSEGTLARAHEIVSGMSLDAKIGQMAQVDIAKILLPHEDGDVTISPNLTAIDYYFGQLQIGSLLNCPNTNGTQWNASEYRNVVQAIENVTDTYGLPPVIWGLDSVHGANYVKGAIVTPQQLNLAATFNISVAYSAGQLASKDTRAAGITWLFSPILGLSLQPLWSRVYETFGEDPLVVSSMGSALIQGIQEADDDPTIQPSRAAACAKHFIGYSMPRTGHDRSPAWIPKRHLYQYFVPPWKVAIEEAGVLTVMESYSEFDGVPNVANYDTTQQLLRNDLGFDGLLVTDYHEVMNLADWHHVTEDWYQATKLMLRDSSVDMSMVPLDEEDFIDEVKAAVRGDIQYPLYPIDVKRIDESAERVVALKVELGMFEETISTESPLIDSVGRDEDRKLALDMARQSIVMVENKESVLPIPVLENASDSEKIQVHVTGPTSNSLSYQSGGWTIDWQGSPSDEFFTYGTTVLDAAQKVAGWEVTHSCGVDILGNHCQNEDKEPPKPVQMRSADYVIVCIGEENYTEKPGDVRDLRLPQGQLDLVRKIKKESKENQKLILLYFGGRPKILDDSPDLADAVAIAFLPGPDGGQAAIDIITGIENPSGKLPITYPKYADGGGAPYFSAVSDICTYGKGTLPHWENRRCDVQWSFGRGLTFTSFEYSELRVSPDIITVEEHDKDLPDITVKINVKNIGDVAGSETVFFFLFDQSRYVTPEYKRLRHFEKIYLEPGEVQMVYWDIHYADLLHIGPSDDTHPVLQTGMHFRVGIGPNVDCRQNPDDALCSQPLQLRTSKYASIGTCDSACHVWENSGCEDVFVTAKAGCNQMCLDVATTNRRHEGWGWDYVKCIESVSREIKAGTSVCSDMTMMCRDIFATPAGNLKQTSTVIEIFQTTPESISVPIAFVAGAMLSGLLVAFLLKRRRKSHGEIEFTPVTTSEGDGAVVAKHFVAEDGVRNARSSEHKVV